MARDGSGTYTNPFPDFVAGTVISSTQVDANNSDIATALTQSIAVDGQSTITGDVPFASNKITGLADGTAAQDAATVAQTGWRLIETQTASTSSSLDFETGLTGTYDQLVLMIADLVPASDNASLQIRVKDTTYKSGASDYDYASASLRSDSSTVAALVSSGATAMVLNVQVGSDTGEGCSGKIEFSSPDSTQFSHFRWMVSDDDFNATDIRTYVGGGRYTTAAAITGVRVMFASGNIESGTVALYGLRTGA